jgi:hypothetical protein
MKIQVNDKDLFELTDTMKKVIKNDIMSDIFEDDMKRRLKWIVDKEYQHCMKSLEGYWLYKLKKSAPSIPLDKAELAKAIMAHPEYKDMKAIKAGK